MSLYTIPPQLSLSFGSFDYFCNQVGLVLCPLVGGQQGTGMEASCYSRNIDINGFLLFEPSVLVLHVVAMVMTGIMIAHVKFKYTAVGRKEILLFFYLYLATVIVEFFTISGIIPFSSGAFPYFAALHTAFAVTCVWTLFFNGFVPFQFVEDGSSTSLWTLRLSSIFIWVVSFFIAIGTFQNLAGMSAAAPGALWTIYFIFTLALVIVYFTSQVFLVVYTLEEKWPIIDILLAAFFFILSQTMAFGFSTQLCQMAQHYIDGLFFSTTLNLLTVMMIYKFWDSITREDLEFSVGIKGNSWEIRDPLLSDAAMAQMASQTALLQMDYGSTRS